ncbi:MAG TPA: sulfite exporter TauE/SafE family protein [Nitrospirota bacterium]|nr:sulfite exporter TauE/SafE family protein [Nitrospirota bacterium]
MLIFFTMFATGLIVGFAGVGGSGIVIALLSAVFKVPIHTALGTSLGAMGFTTLVGSYSHFRERNVVVKCGLGIGMFGAAGAYMGVKIATLLNAYVLTRLTASVLLLCAVMLCLRIFFYPNGISWAMKDKIGKNDLLFWAAASAVGLVSGIMSGAFGISAAVFIQVGLLVFFNLSLPEVAGTTMLVTLPIAMMGGVGYLTAGYLDMGLFITVISGLMSGTYLGAKFTRRLPPAILKTVMVSLPVVAAFLLLFGS